MAFQEVGNADSEICYSWHRLVIDMAPKDFKPSGWLFQVGQDPSTDEVFLEELKATYKEKLKVFEDSIEYKTGKEILNEIFIKNKNIKITSALCLGLSSFSSDSSREARLYHTDFGSVPMAQYIAFVSWIKFLEEGQASPNI